MIIYLIINSLNDKLKLYLIDIIKYTICFPYFQNIILFSKKKL